MDPPGSTTPACADHPPDGVTSCRRVPSRQISPPGSTHICADRSSVRESQGSSRQPPRAARRSSAPSTSWPSTRTRPRPLEPSRGLRTKPRPATAPRRRSAASPPRRSSGSMISIAPARSGGTSPSRAATRCANALSWTRRTTWAGAHASSQPSARASSAASSVESQGTSAPDPSRKSKAARSASGASSSGSRDATRSGTPTIVARRSKSADHHPMMSRTFGRERARRQPRPSSAPRFGKRRDGALIPAGRGGDPCPSGAGRAARARSSPRSVPPPGGRWS